MEDGAIWFVLCVGFWLGFAYRRFGEKRAARHDPHPSWRAMAADIISDARKVEDGHKFAGSGITVSVERRIIIGKLGHFKITTERDQVDA